MTVVGFAEHLGVSARTVSNWESRGAGIEPLPEMQAALDTALGRADAGTRERFQAAVLRALPPAQPQRGARGEAATDLGRLRELGGIGDVGSIGEVDPTHERRPARGPVRPGRVSDPIRVLSAAQVMSAAGIWLSGPAEPLTVRPAGITGGSGSPGGEVSPGLMDTLEARVSQLRRVDDLQGGVVVLRLADHDLTWTLELLGSGAMAPATARRLHTVVAELAQLAGWLACDLGLAGQAQRYWLRGLRAASAAGDPRLGAYIMSCLSYQALWYGQGQQAMALAGIARQGAGEPTSGAVQALLWTRQARACALVRDRPGCEVALERAAASLEATVPAEDPPWIYWVTPAVLVADAGRAMLDLGALKPAEERLSWGLEWFGVEQPRNRMLHLASLAEVRLLRREIDSAAGAAISAAELAVPLQSGRARQRLKALHAAFGREPTGEAQQARERLESVLVG
jgi:transcriptional regulator with XRE-family HTH domain